ncbi:septum formation family protein [Microbacterium sp. TPD7012]|uniref:septum formation family protein n=2 Tax=Microbacterium TaxID=33882 RepID=UPI000D521057|nr:septum formation family protein [Microbacterium sp. TPD7012]PVE92053.1 hypothetical protein DC434_17680 [Microbacterium sp. TPD7012]
MMKLRNRRALMLAGTAVALSIALSGCSAINSILGGGAGDADRDQETGQVTESANIDVFALKVGDCKMSSATGLIEAVDVVPCEEPHDEEVYHEFSMEDGEFSEEAVDAATEGCIGDAFTTFVGVVWDESALDVYPITPTKDTWDQLNDRVIQCVISDPAGPVTGTLAGAAR